MQEILDAINAGATGADVAEEHSDAERHQRQNQNQSHEYPSIDSETVSGFNDVISDLPFRARWPRS